MTDKSAGSNIWGYDTRVVSANLNTSTTYCTSAVFGESFTSTNRFILRGSNLVAQSTASQSVEEAALLDMHSVEYLSTSGRISHIPYDVYRQHPAVAPMLSSSVSFHIHSEANRRIASDAGPLLRSDVYEYGVISPNQPQNPTTYTDYQGQEVPWLDYENLTGGQVFDTLTPRNETVYGSGCSFYYDSTSDTFRSDVRHEIPDVNSYYLGSVYVWPNSGSYVGVNYVRSTVVSQIRSVPVSRPKALGVVLGQAGTAVMPVRIALDDPAVLSELTSKADCACTITISVSGVDAEFSGTYHPSDSTVTIGDYNPLDYPFWYSYLLDWYAQVTSGALNAEQAQQFVGILQFRGGKFAAPMYQSGVVSVAGLFEGDPPVLKGHFVREFDTWLYGLLDNPLWAGRAIVPTGAEQGILLYEEYSSFSWPTAYRLAREAYRAGSNAYNPATEVSVAEYPDPYLSVVIRDDQSSGSASYVSGGGIDFYAPLPTYSLTSIFASHPGQDLFYNAEVLGRSSFRVPFSSIAGESVNYSGVPTPVFFRYVRQYYPSVDRYAIGYLTSYILGAEVGGSRMDQDVQLKTIICSPMGGAEIVDIPSQTVVSSFAEYASNPSGKLIESTSIDVWGPYSSTYCIRGVGSALTPVLDRANTKATSVGYYEVDGEDHSSQYSSLPGSNNQGGLTGEDESLSQYTISIPSYSTSVSSPLVADCPTSALAAEYVAGMPSQGVFFVPKGFIKAGELVVKMRVDRSKNEVTRGKILQFLATQYPPHPQYACTPTVHLYSQGLPVFRLYVANIANQTGYAAWTGYTTILLDGDTGNVLLKKIEIGQHTVHSWRVSEPSLGYIDVPVPLINRSGSVKAFVVLHGYAGAYPYTAKNSYVWESEWLTPTAFRHGSVPFHDTGYSVPTNNYVSGLGTQEYVGSTTWTVGTHALFPPSVGVDRESEYWPIDDHPGVWQPFILYSAMKASPNYWVGLRRFSVFLLHRAYKETMSKSTFVDVVAAINAFTAVAEHVQDTYNGYGFQSDYLGQWYQTNQQANPWYFNPWYPDELDDYKQAVAAILQAFEPYRYAQVLNRHLLYTMFLDQCKDRVISLRNDIGSMGLLFGLELDTIGVGLLPIPVKRKAGLEVVSRWTPVAL